MLWWSLNHHRLKGVDEYNYRVGVQLRLEPWDWKPSLSARRSQLDAQDQMGLWVRFTSFFGLTSIVVFAVTFILRSTDNDHFESSRLIYPDFQSPTSQNEKLRVLHKPA